MTQERKEWLRAVLEGRFKPTRADWEALAGDADYAEIRRMMVRASRLDLTGRAEDLEAMWRVVAAHRGECRRVRFRRRIAGWTAGVAGVVLVVGLWLAAEYEGRRTAPEVPVVATVTGLPQRMQATELILPNGEKRLLGEEERTVVAHDRGTMRTSGRTLIIENGGAEEREPEYYTLNVPYGAEYNLLLPDGTQVYLNAGSRLRYPDRFTGTEREIHLCGEAYLEVARDTLRPFVVHTDKMDVRVLGTVFNVQAYPESEWVRTTLVEGRVEALCGERRFAMRPGTQVALNRASGDASCFPVDVQQFISWKSGYYDFEDIPLGELMRIFERWYAVRIEFADAEIAKEMTFSGRLQRYDDAWELFRLLEYADGVAFDIREDRITVRRK